MRCDRCGAVLSGSRKKDNTGEGHNLRNPEAKGSGYDKKLNLTPDSPQDYFRQAELTAGNGSDLPPYKGHNKPGFRQPEQSGFTKPDYMGAHQGSEQHLSFKDSDQAGKSGGGGKAIIIAVAAAILVIAAGVAGFFIYRSFQGGELQGVTTDKSSSSKGKNDKSGSTRSQSSDDKYDKKTYKNTVTEPEQEYWVVYDGGEKRTQWEMASVDAEGSRDNLKVIWNDGGSLTLEGDQSHSDFNRYRNTSDGEFDLQGSYDSFTSYAHSVLASNLDVYDTDGRLIVKASDWDDTPWGRLTNGALHDEYEDNTDPDDFLTEENFRNQVEIPFGDIIYFIKEDFNGDENDEAYVITGEEDEFTGYNNVNIYYMSGVSGECWSMLEEDELTFGYLHEDSSGNPALISASHYKFLVWEKYAGGSGSLSFVYGVREEGYDSEPQPYVAEISGQYEEFGLYSRDYAELCETDYESDRQGDYVAVESYFEDYHKHRLIFFSFDKASGEFYVED